MGLLFSFTQIANIYCLLEKHNLAEQYLDKLLVLNIFYTFSSVMVLVSLEWQEPWDGPTG
jgi:hypothetical protein